MTKQIKELLPQTFTDKNRDIILDLLGKLFPDTQSYKEDDLKQYIDLLCKSKNVSCEHDPESFTKTTVIEDLGAQVQEQFTGIPGSYMLSDAQQEQYENKLFFAACLKHISENQSQQLSISAELSIDEESIYVEIEKAIDDAAEAYCIPDEYFNTIKTYEESSWISWVWGAHKRLTPVEKLIKKYKSECYKISCFDLLPKEDRDKFLNKLILLQQRIDRDSSSYMDYDTNQQKLQEWNTQVEEAINKKLISQHGLYDAVDTLVKDDIQADLTENTELSDVLKVQLLNAMLEKIKNDMHKPELANNYGITAVCLRIMVAKYLSNICSFNKMAHNEQMNEINHLFEMIEQERDNPSTNEKFKADVSLIIAKLIVKYTDSCYKRNIERIGIANPENIGTFNNILNTIRLFLRTPSAKAAVKGATTAVLATNALPLVGSPVATISSMFTLTGNNTDQLHSISPTKSVVAAGVGAIVGYKYQNIVNNIFPIEYLITEIADIYNNDEKNSLPDRLIRFVPIATTFAAGLVGVATVLTTNPISIPLVSGIALGGLVALPVIGAFSKLANMASKKLHGRLYQGINNPDYYEFTEKGKRAFSGDTGKINMVVGFFKEYIPLLERVLNDLESSGDRADEMNVVQLKDAILVIKKAFEYLRDGENTTKTAFKAFDDAISYILAYQKNLALHDLEQVYTNDIVNNIARLLEISDIYQCLESIKLDPVIQDRLQSIKASNTQIVENLENKMDAIIKVYNIVQPSKSVDISSLSGLPSSQPNDVATSSSNPTDSDLTKRIQSDPIVFKKDGFRKISSINRDACEPKVANSYSGGACRV